MSTKSFIISLPIITGDQDRRRLRKSFSFGCNLQNAVMGGGWDRVLQMRATPEWQATRAMPKGRERTKAFRDLRVRFRLSEYDFHADVAMHRKASGRGHLLGINECQKLASRAWISVERHLYNGGAPRFIIFVFRPQLASASTARSATGFSAMQATSLWSTTVIRRSRGDGSARPSGDMRRQRYTHN